MERLEDGAVVSLPGGRRKEARRAELSEIRFWHDFLRFCPRLGE